MSCRYPDLQRTSASLIHSLDEMCRTEDTSKDIPTWCAPYIKLTIQQNCCRARQASKSDQDYCTCKIAHCLNRKPKGIASQQPGQDGTAPSWMTPSLHPRLGMPRARTASVVWRGVLVVVLLHAALCRCLRQALLHVTHQAQHLVAEQQATPACARMAASDSRFLACKGASHK